MLSKRFKLTKFAKPANPVYTRISTNILLLLISLMILPPNTAAQQIAYGSNLSAGKFYDINGFKMYCEVYGKGKPVLLIHGNNGSIKAFSRNIPYFSARYTVIAADSRAQGKSADPHDSISFEMMADDFAVLLTHMHIDSCYVIGWSDGGIVALLLAMRHPEKVKMLASTGANLWPDSTAVLPSLWKQELMIYRRYRSSPPVTNEQRNQRKLFYLDWFQPHISLKSLGKIKCPALIISGDRDLIDLEHTVLIYQNVPRGFLWVLPHSGHATLYDHPSEFNTKVSEFFRTGFR